MKRVASLSAFCILALGIISFFLLEGAHGRVGGVGMTAPEILNDAWLNGPPQRLAELKGKVVLVEFWTFGCYNCRNVEPHVKEWHDKYHEKGFMIIGVHSPESRTKKTLSRSSAISQSIRYAIRSRSITTS